MLSRSLLPVVKVTKHSRLEVWPMSSEVSGPTDENIHMILFPHSIRSDKDVDQLIKELMDNDLALRAVVGEAEMLIFPSIILPKQYQTFKGKHYLWGVFRPKKDPEGANTQDKVNQESTSAQGSSNASAAAAAATIPANLQWISSSSGIPTGMMFAFVPQPSPRIEQLIQEMQREGVVFVGMPEMAAGPGLVQATAAAAAAAAME
ncbi:uncharacterized protein LOC102707638 [Oryza brachyantha]|uniref:uncharacterized protein LOC102707638 n=1 Tax=Oryza brachyantha TaxID=4533 RepID=UPI0003EA987E|nr:uncharacterized protein LOC102707638 [Oryza brachyantha]